MANNCCYGMRIVGRSEEAVDQFYNALQYEDIKNGYFMCRIFSAYTDDNMLRTKSGLYYMDVYGDCAWSDKCCMIDNGYGEFRGIEYGEPKFNVWRGCNGHIKYSNIGVTAQILCKTLGVSVEIWSSESGVGFQEHYIIASDGTLIKGECVDWVEGYDTDENGDFLDYNEDKDEGGFEDYGEFHAPDTLMKMKGE